MISWSGLWNCFISNFPFKSTDFSCQPFLSERRGMCTRKHMCTHTHLIYWKRECNAKLWVWEVVGVAKVIGCGGHFLITPIIKLVMEVIWRSPFWISRESPDNGGQPWPQLTPELCVCLLVCFVPWVQFTENDQLLNLCIKCFSFVWLAVLGQIFIIK